MSQRTHSHWLCRRLGDLFGVACAAAFLGACRLTPPAVEATERADKLRTAGILSDAQAVYHEAMEKDPKYAPPYRALAEIAEAQHDMPTAIDYWQQYLQRQPDARHGWCFLALAEMRASQEVIALEHAQKELQLAPDCAKAHLAVGLLFVRKGNAKEALTHLEKAVAAYPKNAAVALTYGRVLAMAGQYDDAEKVLAPLTTQKRTAEPIYWLAYCYARRSNDAQSSAKAEELLKEALRLDPQQAAVNFELGRLYVAHRRAAEAVPLLTVAVTNNTNDPAPAYSLAQAYTMLGRATEATNAQTMFKKRSDLSMRRKALLRQLSVSPKDAELNHAFGLLEVERGDIASALLFLEAAHSLAPQSEAITRDWERVRQQNTTVAKEKDTPEDTAIPEIGTETKSQ